MDFKTVMHVLADSNGVFRHYIHYDGKNGSPHCYCDSSLPILRCRTSWCPYTQVLSCKVCDDRRRKILVWMERAEETEREAERKLKEEGESA